MAASRSAQSNHRELLSSFWNFSVFWNTDHGKRLACEFGFGIPGKIAGKVNAWKEKVWNFTKNFFVQSWVVSQTTKMDILTWRQYVDENWETEI